MNLQKKLVIYIKHQDDEEPNHILQHLINFSQQSLLLHIIPLPRNGFSHQKTYSVTDNTSVMNLYNFIKLYGPLPEHAARDVIRQIILVIKECNQISMHPKIISRSNIYINITNMHVKLIIPETIHPSDNISTWTHKLPCSIYYYPPEWFKEKKFHPESYQTWNIGLLLFFILYNKMPFRSPWEILYCPVFLSTHHRSLDVNLFIGWCLTKNVKKRISLQECLHHPWITQLFI